MCVAFAFFLPCFFRSSVYGSFAGILLSSLYSLRHILCSFHGTFLYLIPCMLSDMLCGLLQVEDPFISYYTDGISIDGRMIRVFRTTIIIVIF